MAQLLLHGCKQLVGVEKAAGQVSGRQRPAKAQGTESSAGRRGSTQHVAGTKNHGSNGQVLERSQRLALDEGYPLVSEMHPEVADEDKLFGLRPGHHLSE